MPRQSCTRCRKRSDILFEFERITKSAGVRELRLCSHCTKWAMVSIMTDSALGSRAFELVFMQSEAIREYLAGQAGLKYVSQTNTNPANPLPNENQL